MAKLDATVHVTDVVGATKLRKELDEVTKQRDAARYAIVLTLHALQGAREIAGTSDERRWRLPASVERKLRMTLDKLPLAEKSK